jgi:hypothetical protein
MDLNQNNGENLNKVYQQFQSEELSEIPKKLIFTNQQNPIEIYL